MRSQMLAVLAATGVVAVGQPVVVGPQTDLIPGGAVAGGDRLVMPFGSITGIRDVQCGVKTAVRADLNCDFGAGNARDRGDVIVNYDVGRCFVVMNGYRLPLARFCGAEGRVRGSILFYVRPRVVQ